MKRDSSFFRRWCPQMIHEKVRTRCKRSNSGSSHHVILCEWCQSEWLPPPCSRPWTGNDQWSWLSSRCSDGAENAMTFHFSYQFPRSVLEVPSLCLVPAYSSCCCYVFSILADQKLEIHCWCSWPLALLCMAVSPETKGVSRICWKGIVIIGRHLDTLNISGKTVMETDVINTYCLLLLIKWITLSMIEVS